MEWLLLMSEARLYISNMVQWPSYIGGHNDQDQEHLERSL